MITRYSTILVTLCLMTAAEGLVASAAAQQSPASAAGSWVVPRTPDGHPDLQGNWTNLTITPFERPEDQESPVLTLEEVQERQGYAVDLYVRRAQPSDPRSAGATAWGSLEVQAVAGISNGQPAHYCRVRVQRRLFRTGHHHRHRQW